MPNPPLPPPFNEIASELVKSAFIVRRPDAAVWVEPGTKLYKWTNSITNRTGVSPWWFFLESRIVAGKFKVEGLRERQARAANIGANDRDFHRVRAGVTKQWNPMTEAMGISLTNGAWGYVGRAAGQLKDATDEMVVLIAGEVQVWIPGLQMKDVTQFSMLPYMAT